MIWIIFFFLIGASLLFVECFMPGLICGIAGVGFLVASGWLAMRDYPDFAVVIILAEVLGTILTIICGFYFLPKTRLGRRMILNTAQHPGSGWVSDKTNTDLLGTVAKVSSALRPAGTIHVNGQRINAVSTGEFIQDGAEVRVIEVHGNRVVVELASADKERGS